jgi:3-mercaptopyruvate sulfurtransferase SseA
MGLVWNLVAKRYWKNGTSCAKYSLRVVSPSDIADACGVSSEIIDARGVSSEFAGRERHFVELNGHIIQTIHLSMSEAATKTNHRKHNEGTTKTQRKYI